MNNIKNIIFDYGNVIFTLDFKRSRDAWAALGITDPDAFYSHQRQDKIFTEFESGAATSEQFRAYIRLVLNHPDLTDDQIDHAWNSLLVGVSDGNHELLLKLKLHYRTFLLSNINPIHYDYIMDYLKRDFGFESNDHLFEKAYYSHLMGKRKPNADIFEQVLTENNLAPAETLFIDDNPQNIEAAKKLGIQTYLMTAPDSIQDYFRTWN